VQEYKYSTVLLPKEFVAYTHLPRVSEGGIFAEVGDVPKFAVPSMLKGEIYMGSILSAERYSMHNGYTTPYDYRISEKELMHGFFTGASRSGKTVAAMRFVAELSRIRRSKTGKRLRIICMDPKQDWRGLARFVEPERFRFYSMGNPNFHPLHFNPCKIPRGVIPQIWVDVLIEIYCRAYGLLERGKQLMAETFYSLYEETGVFDVYGKPGWEDEVPLLSSNVTFAKAYERMTYYKRQMDDGTSARGRGGNDTKDAYARLLERLSAFGRPFSIERRLFGEADGLGVDDIIGADDITILESKGLESTFKNFIFGVITAGFYRYAIAQPNGYLAPDQYETVLVIEEANEVLTGSDTAGTGNTQMGLSGQSEFEQILDQSAGYGLFIFAITQKIADMPKSIIANAGLVFAGKVKTEDDVNVIVKTIAKDPRYDDRDVTKWFPRSPTGWFVCQSSRTMNFMDAEPILVKISMLNVSQPTNAEIDEMLAEREVILALKEHSAS
ncbi:MAG: serine-rich protein, partial [Oscillospiraceae bacterium]|nr:serine-rich protein [Oscillospiraceae bacterium]